MSCADVSEKKMSELHIVRCQYLPSGYINTGIYTRMLGVNTQGVE